MHIPGKLLTIRTSTIPQAGSGLFTKTFIPKDSFITEYKGRITSWATVKHDADNAYLYYVNSRHVIDGKPFLKSLARFANDAAGLNRIKGITNNSVYEKVGKKIFIKAIRDIAEGSEILVSYGKEYWDTEKRNRKLAHDKISRDRSLDPE